VTDVFRTLETCEISLWRGYVKCGFVALPTEETRLLGEPPASRLFRHKGNDEPVAEGVAGHAHAELVERLLADGWEPVGRGSTWYSQRFARAGFDVAPAAGAAPVLPLAEDARSEAFALAAPEATAVPEPPPVAASEQALMAGVERAAAPDAQSSVPGHELETPLERKTPAEVIAPATDPARTAVPSRAGAGQKMKRSRSRRNEQIASPGLGNRGYRLRVAGALLGASVAGVIAAIAPSLVKTNSAAGHPPAKQVVSAPANPKAVAPRPIRVMIVATRGDSWVEARVDSAAGRILYSGLLVRGQVQRVSARRVWLRLAAASNLTVLANGKPPRKPLVGTMNLVLGPTHSGKS
jgi:hypothetical protein